MPDVAPIPMPPTTGGQLSDPAGPEPVHHAQPPSGDGSAPSIASGDTDVSMPAADSPIPAYDAAHGTCNGQHSSVASTPLPAMATASKPPSNGTPLSWSAVAANPAKTMQPMAPPMQPMAQPIAPIDTSPGAVYHRVLDAIETSHNALVQLVTGEFAAVQVAPGAPRKPPSLLPHRVVCVCVRCGGGICPLPSASPPALV